MVITLEEPEYKIGSTQDVEITKVVGWGQSTKNRAGPDFLGFIEDLIGRVRLNGIRVTWLVSRVALRWILRINKITCAHLMAL